VSPQAPCLALLLGLALAACARSERSDDAPTAAPSSAAVPPAATASAAAPGATAATGPRAGDGGPMVTIPAGQLIAGSACGAVPRVTNEEAAGVPVTLGAFRIDVYPWPNDPTRPAQTGVSRDQAASSCAAVGKRLCTEIEWERACKGPANATFEYGEAYDKEACKSGAATPGARAKCASAFGVRDLHGMVFEWTATPWGRSSDPSLFTVKGSAGVASVLRERCANGQGRQPGVGSSDLGFRCCADAATAIQPFAPPAKQPVLVAERRVDPVLEEALLKAMPEDHRVIDGARVAFDRLWRWHPRDGEELIVARWVARPKKGKAAFELAVFKECAGKPARIARMRGPVARLEAPEPTPGASAEKLTVHVEAGKDRGDVVLTYWYGSVKVDEPAWIEAGNQLKDERPSIKGKVVRPARTREKP
jgi:sulfatase modifying factor 1